MKSEGFRVLVTKKKSLALHVCSTINQTERGMHDFKFLVENVCFSSLSARLSFPFSLSFCLIGNCNPSFLQNSPLLSRQFIAKFDIKTEVVVYELVK